MCHEDRRQCASCIGVAILAMGGGAADRTAQSGRYGAFLALTQHNDAIEGRIMRQPNDRLCALADSLPAAIRWRFSDYEQLLRKQLQILAVPPLRLAGRRRDYDSADATPE